MSDLKIESTTLWDFPRQNYGSISHGDNKYNGVTPALVIWNLLQRYTKEGDLVVDPMCGSGTTLRVAKELNRNYIGMDISSEYCAIAERRVANADKYLKELDRQQSLI